MAARQIIADSKAPLRRLILSRIMKQSHANGQDRLLPLLVNPNQTDRLLRPVRELNQRSRTDVAAVVQELFGLWFRQPVFEEQTRVSARGRQIPKEDETEDSEEEKEEVVGEFEAIKNYDDDDDDDCEDDDDDDGDGDGDEGDIGSSSSCDW